MLAESPDTPPEVLVSFLFYLSLDVKRAAAANPSLPLDVLEELITEKEPELEIALRSNPHYSKIVKNSTD
ncbi:MAG: hypothetical protein QXL94_00650 [Candidatus Parvarchaeum sp.]